MVTAVRRSDTTRAVSLFIEIASPATAFAFWPWSTPLTTHTRHVFTASHFAPIVFAVCVASVSCRNLSHVVTWSNHGVFVSSWPVHCAHLWLVVVESAFECENLLCCRLGHFLISRINGINPDGVASKRFDLSPDVHLVQFLVHHIEISDLIDNLIVLDPVSVGFNFVMAQLSSIDVLYVKSDLELSVLNVFNVNNDLWWASLKILDQILSEPFSWHWSYENPHKNNVPDSVFRYQAESLAMTFNKNTDLIKFYQLKLRYERESANKALNLIYSVVFRRAKAERLSFFRAFQNRCKKVRRELNYRSKVYLQQLLSHEVCSVWTWPL